MHATPSSSAPSSPAAIVGAAGAPTVGWPELIAQRAYLVRYARRQLRDPALAEDAVHDVFEAVLSGRALFAGRSALRSWLTAVLKHKIVDAVRRDARFAPLDDECADGGALAIECPQPRPDEIAEQRERLARTLERIDELPQALRETLQRRVLDDQSTADVCAALDISEENLFVRLHRARKRLLC